MPLISLFVPQGGWASAQWILSQNIDPTGKIAVNAIKYGHFISAIIDFLIVSFCRFYHDQIPGRQATCFRAN